ncbi:MAG TPA: hypothetical protein VKB76_12410, partial [Ktedonobacterales bacterium]|nr:hypothetical protein [Ktedonobacterales bacterium]
MSRSEKRMLTRAGGDTKFAFGAGFSLNGIECANAGRGSTRKAAVLIANAMTISRNERRAEL